MAVLSVWSILKLLFCMSARETIVVMSVNRLTRQSYLLHHPQSSNSNRSGIFSIESSIIIRWTGADTEQAELLSPKRRWKVRTRVLIEAYIGKRRVTDCELCASRL